MVDLNALHDELEVACMEVFDGSPAGALQASRVERAIGDVLRRRGLRGQVQVTAGGQAARVVLLPNGPRAKQVVLTVQLG